jgi:hypothetical protein
VSRETTAPRAAEPVNRAAGPDPIPLEQRLLALEAAVVLLRPLTQASRLQLEELADEIAALRRADMQATAIDAVGPAEERVMQIEAQIPASALRRMALADAEQTARYAGLLARHAKDSTARIDRVELLVTRLCTDGAGNGKRALRPRAEVAGLLRLAGIAGNGDATRAVGFFAAASQRLGTLASVSDVFDGGLYVDSRGYKISLKELRLDPDVLYAATSFNLAFQIRLEELQRAANMPDTELAECFRKAEAQIDLLFGDPAHRGETQGLDSVAAGDRLRTDPIPMPSGARRKRLHLLRAVGVAVALAGAVLLFVRGRGSSKLVPLPTKELAALSPLLESGSLAAGPDSFLVGKIPSSRWFLMSRSERRSAASTLRNRLMRKKVTAAIVFGDDNVLAIQIEQGRVLAVE